MVKIDLRVVTMEVPPQEVITRDNVTMRVTAVLYFRVVDPGAAVTRVADYVRATFQIAQTTLRNVLGQSDLDELLANREQINDRLQEIIDTQTEPWGIKVTAVEVKDLELPNRCSGPWPGRPRPSARSAPRSSTPRASCRPRRRWPTRAGDRLAARHVAASLPADAHRDLDRAQLDDHLPRSQSTS
jgi:hypothetical protein